MNSLVIVILLPVATALLAFLFNRLRNEFSFIGAVLTFYFALRIYLTCRVRNISYNLFELLGINFSIYADAFSGFFLLVLAFLSLGLVFYSFRYIRSLIPKQQNLYHFYLIATLGLANGGILAKNFSLLLLFLGFLTLTAYGMLLLARENNITPGVQPASGRKGNKLPATTFAFIFVILDILGIYLLVRISLYWFDLSASLVTRYSLLVIGIFTILSFAIIALRQNDLIRRLSFFQISQVGYIILGIGSLTPLGIVGGIFHLLNNLMFSIGLILLAGSIGFRTKNQDLNNLGGLAGKMPLTFGAFFVLALAISGIPPLNGFFSQWLIFQSLLSLRSAFVNIFIAAAILGSILTLIAFLRMTQTIFFGKRASYNHVIEVGFSMNLVPITLAIICLIFGIFVKVIPLHLFVLPSLRPIFDAFGGLTPGLNFWTKAPITIIMISWVVVGILLYFLSWLGWIKLKSKPAFIGGEKSKVTTQSTKSGMNLLKRIPIAKPMWASVRTGRDNNG